MNESKLTPALSEMPPKKGHAKFYWLLILLEIPAMIMILRAYAFIGALAEDPSGNVSPIRTYTISQSGSFSAEETWLRGLSDKAIMIMSKYCQRCSNTLIDFKNACQKKGVDPIVLDMANSTDQRELERYNVDVQYVPTFIIGGRYFVGARSEEEYRSLLDLLLKG